MSQNYWLVNKLRIVGQIGRIIPNIITKTTHIHLGVEFIDFFHSLQMNKEMKKRWFSAMSIFSTLYLFYFYNRKHYI